MVKRYLEVSDTVQVSDSTQVSDTIVDDQCTLQFE